MSTSRGKQDSYLSEDPLCFILMPFGRKPTDSGKFIDFEAVYQQLIVPAIRAAGLEPIRADEQTGSAVHKTTFERLIACEYVVADLTLPNANVYYELGVRHAVRPYSTALLFASGTRLPFDVQTTRPLPYFVSEMGAPADSQATSRQLTKRLIAARDQSVDSPVFQLVEGFPDIGGLKTDLFRDQINYAEQRKAQLAVARTAQPERIDAVREVERELGDLRDMEVGILIDLFLSYRAVGGYEDMVRLVEDMPPSLAEATMVREQLGLALARVRHGDVPLCLRKAEHVLLKLIDERGPSSETYGILGRVYKDMWEEAARAGETLRATGLLDRAIGAYLKGFEADWRDVYPGINAVTLMEIRAPPDPLREQLIPVVSYAAERRLASGGADYWDHATRLEIAVLAKDEQGAWSALDQALAAVRGLWEARATRNSLKLIREARERRGDVVPWALAIEERLQTAGAP